MRSSAVLAEPRSTAPPRCTSRRRRSRPHDELATWPLASLSCPSTDPASLPHPHRLGAPSPASPPPRQRQPLPPCQDAFHRRVLPPPVALSACAPARGITRNLSPVSLLACFVAFATAIRLPAPLHPLSAPASAGGQRARPRTSRSWTGRRSSTSATNSTREHDHGPPDPRLSCKGTKPACARALRSPRPSGNAEGPIERRSVSSARQPIPAPSTGSATARRTRGRSPTPPRPAAARRGFTGQGPDGPKPGPAGSIARLSPAMARSAERPFRASLWERELPQPDPLGHLSS